MAMERRETQRPAWWREFEREREAAREPPSCLPGDPVLVARFQRDTAALVRLFRAGTPWHPSDLAFVRRVAADLDAAARLWGSSE